MFRVSTAPFDLEYKNQNFSSRFIHALFNLLKRFSFLKIHSSAPWRLIIGSDHSTLFSSRRIFHKHICFTSGQGQKQLHEAFLQRVFDELLLFSNFYSQASHLITCRCYDCAHRSINIHGMIHGKNIDVASEQFSDFESFGG